MCVYIGVLRVSTMFNRKSAPEVEVECIILKKQDIYNKITLAFQKGSISFFRTKRNIIFSYQTCIVALLIVCSLEMSWYITPLFAESNCESSNGVSPNT